MKWRSEITGAATADDATILASLGYTAEQRAAIPEGADLGLGCGNPLAHAGLPLRLRQDPPVGADAGLGELADPAV